jgi:hypothetical protein
MSTKTISAAVIGAILIAALALFLRHAPHPDADAASDDRSTPRETEAVPTARPQSPDAPAASNDTPRNENPDHVGAALPQPGPPAPMTEALEELKLPPVPEILDTEQAFAAEAVDPLWSQEAETHILSEIAQVTGLKLVTLRVECKTTLCRLHVAQQELSRTDPFSQLVGRLGLTPRWVVTVVDRNGVPTSLAYLEREGTAPNANSGTIVLQRR